MAGRSCSCSGQSRRAISSPPCRPVDELEKKVACSASEGDRSAGPGDILPTRAVLRIADLHRPVQVRARRLFRRDAVSYLLRSGAPADRDHGDRRLCAGGNPVRIGALQLRLFRRVLFLRHDLQLSMAELLLHPGLQPSARRIVGGGLCYRVSAAGAFYRIATTSTLRAVEADA